MDSQPGARLFDRGDGETRHLLRESPGLLETLEHVAGDSALGQNKQPSTCRSRLLEPSDDGFEVAIDLAERGLGLRDGDEHRRAQSSEPTRCVSPRG
ncbi:MAG: hypothetical protein OXG37_15685 [Actinomycetia bacterium]|nr:hypothetical protein [Actinomycetes bacterium]